MLLITHSYVTKILPVLKLSLYKTELNFFIQTYLFKNVLNVLKNHINYQFKVLTCISGIDCPNNLFRFFLLYEFLSIKYNFRIRLRLLLDDVTPMNSIECIMPGAYWWECEIWDMFGVFFFSKNETIRLLTDYGFHGHPLKKDFPLSGYLELKYSFIKNKVVYENVELAQKYRIFDFISPWENF